MFGIGQISYSSSIRISLNMESILICAIKSVVLTLLSTAIDAIIQKFKISLKKKLTTKKYVNCGLRIANNISFTQIAACIRMNQYEKDKD